MGLLSKLGLKPTAAMLAKAGGGAAARDLPSKAHGQGAQEQGKAAATQSLEMKSLVARFQALMGQIKALEASQATEAGALKKATIAAGNLSTSPKGIVRANAALDQVEAQIEDAKLKLAEAQPAEEDPADGAPPDAGKPASDAGKKLAGAVGKHLKALQDRRRDPLAAKLKKDAKATALAPTGGRAPAEESPALKQAKAQFKRVMAEIRKLADAQVPQAEALKQAAVAAGYLATSPKGIEQAMLALDKVMSDAAKAKADAAQAKADGEKAEADAAKAATETFDLAVGGKKLVGVHRDEAMRALRLEVGRLSAQLESGWAYHVDQMNLPSEVPFQAWLTTGVDAVKSFVKGQDAAKIPDLNIWDPAREMMIDIKRAEKKGDVKAIAAVLPKLAASIPQARAKVGKYQEQMEGSAQTGVDAGRFVEDTSASVIGKLAEKEGGTAGKVAAQSAAQGLFQGVEQLTEWLIGSRQHADPGAIARKAGEEAVGAIFKELVSGALKGPFKSAFGSYLGKGVDDATLKAMNLSRDAFMTGAQKYFAEFAAKQGAGLIKSAIAKLIGGKLPTSPQALVDAIAAELTKGSAKQLIVDGVKEIAKAAVVPK